MRFEEQGEDAIHYYPHRTASPCSLRAVCHRGTNGYSYVHCDPYPHAHANPNTHTHTNAYSYAEGRSISHASQTQPYTYRATPASSQYPA